MGARAVVRAWTQPIRADPGRTALICAIAWLVVGTTLSCANLADSGNNAPVTTRLPTVSSANSDASQDGSSAASGSSAATPTVTGSQPSAVASPTVRSVSNGQTLRVANTNGDGVYLRQAPAVGEPLRILGDGTVVSVVGPSREVDGRTWHQVQTPDGVVGWVAGDFLVESEQQIAVATPSAIPTLPQSSAAPPTAIAVEVRGVAFVGNTGGEGVYLRRTPVMTDRTIAWPDGTRLDILGDETWSDGRTWRLVRDPNGNIGWVPTAYLVMADSPSDHGGIAGADERTYVFAQRWSGEIAYCVNAGTTPPPLTPVQFVDAVERAFTIWQTATGGAIPLVNRGVCDSNPMNLRDGSNTIGWGSLVEAGVTSVRYVRLRIVEGDVMINTSLARRRDAQECLSFVLTHEIGHFLGLAHASPRIESVMTEGGGRCRIIDELPESDVRNIRLLYPGPVR